MTGNQPNKKVNETFIQWSLEGIKDFYTKFISNVLGQVVAWLVTSSLGIWIFAGIIGFFVILINWLKIPVTLPVYIVAIIIAVVFLTGVGYKNFYPKLSMIFSRTEEKELYGLLWKIDKNKNLTGPFCPTCRSKVIAPVSFEQQAENIGDFLMGKDSIYTYRCTSCPYHKELSLDNDELMETVMQALELISISV